MLHYFFGLKYPVLIKYFNAIQTIFVTVSKVEKYCGYSRSNTDVQTWLIVIFAVITFASLIGNCQKGLLYSYVVIFVYISLRYYFLSQNLLSWLKITVYFFISLLMIFVIARMFIKW